MSLAAGTAPIPDDLVRPFQVESTGVRGRLVRLGPAIDSILTRHAYPEPIARLVGEAVAMAALLGVSLKFDGDLIVQAQGDGPVGLLVAQFRPPGDLKGYARFDTSTLAELDSREPVALRALMGTGHFAITIDPGEGMRRYQGFVPLAEDRLAACAHEYFRNSEQIATHMALAVGRSYEAATGRESWRAGGLLVQHLAAEGGLIDPDELEARRDAQIPVLTDGGEDVEEAWERVAKLAATVEDAELLDPALTPERLLYRLFHEDGVRVFDTQPVTDTCSCSRDKVATVLANYSREELEETAKDGTIEVTCEFCSTRYDFRLEEIPGQTD